MINIIILLFVILLLNININYVVGDCDCGLDSAQSRIYLGSETTPNKYPWMAYIRIMLHKDDPRYIKCGGSLIDNQHVMTAAHCIFDENGKLRNKKLIEIYLGVHNMAHVHNNKYRVEKFIFDKRFDILNKKLNYDFALIRLTKTVKFNDKIYPICIPKNEVKDLDKLIVAGWGRLSVTQSAPNALNEVQVNFIDAKKCNKMNYQFTLRSRGLIENYPGEYSSLVPKIHESHMCAIDTINGAGACIGDSGGPLMYKNPKNHRWYAVGIVSGGYGVCGNVEVPTLYTITSKYKNFIKRHATKSQICAL